MARTYCLGCNSIGEWGKQGRCTQCRVKRDRVRYNDPHRLARKRLLYDAEYRRTRKLYVDAQLAGMTLTCPRCGQIIPGDFDLGHQDDGSLKPEHADCNRSAGAAESSKVRY